ncbi:glycosyltransferase involved in cell wall biosynthesis [Mycoplana sp. BE70]|uniref:glycosyltransferase family 4 protein n=1 Tax=Mycoplana sp. BE70 TaxID=2817775 RepID=UPI002856BDDC|nr:glycosyltransferase family 4 protein [Mycoplana sp. BE70]MDR6755323.1 glycosyltransferase involved in cell wall biosynthesis [Mycoplana sp. BE70]
MKVLIFGHRLEVGGTQVNAIELSAYLRDACGHQVTYFASAGPMQDLLDNAGITFRPIPDTRSHPSVARMRVIDEIIRLERPDVVHVWDWPQWLDAFLGIQLYRKVPVVVTCMSMVVPSLLPKRALTTFGTPDLVSQARAAGFRRAELIVPPVDVKFNAPDVIDPTAFRKQFGIAEQDVLVVTVSRLTDWMKSESIRRTMDAVRALGSDTRLRFAIVGDGTARNDLEEYARGVNAELGRDAILFSGALLDPRPGYAAADIVVGMGGSAMRGMAFSKPVIVVGEHGFSDLFAPETEEFFTFNGMYGLGDGNPSNDHLIAALKRLLDSSQDRRSLGDFARQYVERHYSIDTIGQRLNELLETAATSPVRFRHAVHDAVRTASLAVAGRLTRRHRSQQH